MREPGRVASPVFTAFCITNLAFCELIQPYYINDSASTACIWASLGFRRFASRFTPSPFRHRLHCARPTMAPTEKPTLRYITSDYTAEASVLRASTGMSELLVHLVNNGNYATVATPCTPSNDSITPVTPR
jgi:hypothetical protein